MISKKYLIVSIDSLPEVYQKVQEAKELINNNEVKNISEAVKQVGISRSSFYKYCDSIFAFEEKMNNNTMSIGLKLIHKSGVLSKVLNLFATNNANVLTIKQDPPSGGGANVRITFETNNLLIGMDQFVDILENHEDVIELLDINA